MIMMSDMIIMSVVYCSHTCLYYNWFIDQAYGPCYKVYCANVYCQLNTASQKVRSP